jgi:hypothetical protein
MNERGQISVLGTLILALASSVMLSAQDRAVPAGAAPVNSQVGQGKGLPPAGGSHTLQSTYFSNGNRFSGMVAPATFVGVDSVQNITCPGTGTCSIEADMWVETGNIDLGTPNNFAICAAVDGVFFENGTCYYTANTPSDFSFVTGTRSDTIGGISAGTHTVQTFIYSNNGTAVQQYNISYRVYKP